MACAISEDSYQTADEQADLSLLWLHLSYCRFCHVHLFCFFTKMHHNIHFQQAIRKNDQIWLKELCKNQGLVVQSVVSLTSSRVISLTVLADSIYNILILFAEKM